MTTELLKDAEMYAILNISRETFYRWKRKGLPCIKFGGVSRYDKDAVLNWLKGVSK